MRRLLRTLLVTVAVTGQTAVPRVASAQSPALTGAVRSAQSPLVGATVRILELDRSVRSGEAGTFAFATLPPGTYTVHAGLEGFASVAQTVTIGNVAAHADFTLATSVFPLAELVVSATPDARPANQVYQSAESRGLRDFQGAAGNSWAERLSDLPGVNVRLLGSAAARPVLRGLGDNEVLILENGLRMGDLASFDPAHATPISSASIQQVDVVRGPATVLYGPNTIGGLVNVITNLVPLPSDQTMSGSVVTELNAGNDGYATTFNHVISGGDQAFRVSAGEVNSNNIRIPNNTYVDEASGVGFRLDRLPQTFNRSSEVGLGWSTATSWGSIGVGGRHYAMDYGIPGVPVNANFVNAPPGTSRIKQERNTLELRGLYRPREGFFTQFKLDASFNDYTHAEYPTAQDSTGISAPQANHFHKQALNISLQMQHAPIGAWRGTVGLWTNFEDLTIAGDEPLAPNSRTLGLAAFAFEEMTITPSTRLQAGARFDHNGIQTRPYPASTDSVFRTHNQSRTTNAFTASVGLLHDVTSNLTASVNVARSFRAPSVQELFADGLDAASGTYTLGSAALDPETGTGIEAALKGRFARVTFEVTPYANFVGNYIYAFLRGDTIQGQPVRKFAHTTARLLGVEVAGTVQLLEHVALRASVDAVRGTDTDRREHLPFIPPMRGLVRATWRDGRWNALVEWRGASDQTRLGEGDTFTGGYGLLNLGVGARFVQGGIVHQLTLRADNVFNRDYRDHLSVIKDFLPMPGFGLRLNYQILY